MYPDYQVKMIHSVNINTKQIFIQSDVGIFTTFQGLANRTTDKQVHLMQAPCRVMRVNFCNTL